MIPIAVIWLLCAVIAILIPIWWNTIQVPDLEFVVMLYKPRGQPWYWVDKGGQEHPLSRIRAWKLRFSYTPALKGYTWVEDENGEAEIEL